MCFIVAMDYNILYNFIINYSILLLKYENERIYFTISHDHSVHYGDDWNLLDPTN